MNNRHLLAVALCATISLSTNALAAEPPGNPARDPAVAAIFADKVSLGTWFSRFYQEPRPELVADAILQANKLGMWRQGERAFAYFGFLAGVFSKYPDQARTIAMRLVDLPPPDQPAIVLGIWYSTAPDRNEVMKSLSEKIPAHKDTILYLASNTPSAVADLPIDQGEWVLDVLWGYYMATGDMKPVRHIIDALAWSKDPTGSATWNAALRSKNSLMTLASHHPAVMKVLESEATSRPAPIGEQLTAMVSEVRKAKADAAAASPVATPRLPTARQ